MRCIAGSVAPIAAVAGSSSTKLPQKAMAHCHAAVGCTPVRSSSQVLAGDMTSISSALQSAMPSSQSA